MVESVALEMRSAGNGTEGSNPSLSSIYFAWCVDKPPLFTGAAFSFLHSLKPVFEGR